MWRQQAQQQQQQQSQDVPSVKVNRSATSCSSGSILGSWTQLQEWAHTPVEDPLANGGKEGPVWVLKFSLDGRYLASGGQDGVVRGMPDIRTFEVSVSLLNDGK